MSPRSTVFVDSNVFFGARLRSLLLYLAQTKLLRLRWSGRIHEEWMRAVAEERGIDISRLARTRDLMDTAVPDAVVEGFEALEASIDLPDPDDRHVVAAAIRAGAGLILTFNDKDFPPTTLRALGLETRHPDLFLLHVHDLGPELFSEAVRRDLAHYVAPELSIETYLDSLRRAGAPRTATLIARMEIPGRAS